MKNRGGETKIFKKRDMLGKGVGSGVRGVSKGVGGYGLLTNCGCLRIMTLNPSFP